MCHSIVLYLIIMKADKNAEFFRKEEWKNMLKKGMPSKLQAVEKDPPKNPGPELQAVVIHNSDGESTCSPSEYFPRAPPDNPGLKPRGSIEGGLVFRINLFRECGLVFRINLFRKCVV